MKTRLACPKVKPHCEWNGKVIKDGEAGRQGAGWYKVTFTLDFLALKGLIIFKCSKTQSFEYKQPKLIRNS